MSPSSRAPLRGAESRETETERRIDINVNPDVYVELQGTIETDERGAARLVPHGEHRNRWRGSLARIKGKANFKHVTVLISREKEGRRLRQNRYLFACYRIALEAVRGRAADAGVRCPFANTDKMHAWFRDRTLGRDVQEFDGDEIEQDATTTTLSVREFYAYVEAFREYALHRWECYIPTPEEMGEDSWLDGRNWHELGA